MTVFIDTSLLLAVYPPIENDRGKTGRNTSLSELSETDCGYTELAGQVLGRYLCRDPLGQMVRRCHSDGPARRTLEEAALVNRSTGSNGHNSLLAASLKCTGIWS